MPAVLNTNLAATYQAERWQPAVFPATTPTLGYSKSFAQEFVSLQVSRLFL